MAKYNVNASVKLVVDVIVEFDDDGKTDLRDQAHEAAIEHAIDEHSLPCMLRHEMEVDGLVYEEVTE